MIFYKENVVKNTVLLKIKNYILIFLTLISIIQIFISNFNQTSLLIVSMILFSTFYMMNKIFNSKYIIEHFIPFFIVFSLNIAYLSAPLIFKTILIHDISSNLFLPITTFAIASIYQIVLVLTLIFFVSSNNLKKISSTIANGIIFKLKGYVFPSLNFLYFIFIFLFINRFYLYVIDQGINSTTDYGNITMKIFYGIDFFYYVPLFYSFHLFQIRETSKKHLYLIFFIYIISGVFFGFTSGSRTLVFIFFLYILYLVLFYRIFFFKKYLKPTNIVLIIIIFIFFLNSNFINETILKFRGYKYEVSAIELYQLSVGNKLIAEDATKELNAESYTGGFMMDRFITIKFLDKSLYHSKDFNKAQKDEFTDFSLKRILFILPQNLVNIFDKNYMKDDYAIATGSLIDRIYYGHDKGGLLGSGAYLAELIIIFDSYILSCLFIFVLFLFVFTIFDSLQKKNEFSFVFSPLVGVLCMSFMNVSYADSVVGIIGLSTRGFIQTLLLNFILISIYLKFFKKDENIPDR